MAGNVKEWCWNALGNRRYILGAAWNEPRARYATVDARAPFDRSPENGFRCIRDTAGQFEDAADQQGLRRPVERASRDYDGESPASDAEFRILESLYSYDRTELRAVKQSVDESSPYWRAEQITIDAAYDHQRLPLWIYLPRRVRPPYQTIVYFPPGHAVNVSEVDGAEINMFGFLVRTGRAVLFPIYQGTFQRKSNNPLGPSGTRDMVIQECKDLRRSLDYLETRADIAKDRLGYYGISGGARLGSIMLAEEPRIRAAVLAEAGLATSRKPREIDEFNFAPRVRIPVLMLDGRDDLVYPLETNQKIMFRLLGTPSDDKRLMVFESGHQETASQHVREAVDWFDHYLGPVAR